MRCPRCQHENPSGQKFCGACGTPLTASPSGPPAPSYTEITNALSEALEQQTATAELRQARNRELAEALEQQTATSEILRVIASSPTDLQPVMEAVAESAARLCEANNVVVYRLEDRVLRMVAVRGPWPAHEEIPLTRDVPSGRAVIDRETVHIPDVMAAGDEYPGAPALGLPTHTRAILVAPLVRKGEAIGTITIRRDTPGLFTDKQVQLLKTFADQAVIAIENVRLFRELQARNRDLTEALDQQTATSEILRVISSSPTDLQPVFEAIAASALRLCGATWSGVELLDGEMLQLAAMHNIVGQTADVIRGMYPMPLSRRQATTRAVLEGAVVYVPDVLAEPEYAARDMAQAIGYRSVLAVPMLRDGVALGTLGVLGAEPGMFSGRQIELLRTFADQAVIAIENVRLFNETKEALEQQTATADILRVIASSPTDLEPVMQAVAENAARVCGATDSTILRLEGEHLRLMALHGPLRRSMAIGEAIPVSRGTVGGRVVHDRRTIHVEDIMLAEAEFPETVSRMRQTGSLTRTMLGTPLLREGTPLGVIFIARGPQPHPFSAKQIDLLETFANQAVIAIENVRLFQELEARNRELTEALEQQTATSEVLKVISRSAFDLQPVLDLVAERDRGWAGPVASLRLGGECCGGAAPRRAAAASMSIGGRGGPECREHTEHVGARRSHPADDAHRGRAGGPGYRPCRRPALGGFRTRAWHSAAPGRRAVIGVDLHAADAG